MCLVCPNAVWHLLSLPLTDSLGSDKSNGFSLYPCNPKLPLKLPLSHKHRSYAAHFPEPELDDGGYQTQGPFFNQAFSLLPSLLLVSALIFPLVSCGFSLCVSPSPNSGCVVRQFVFQPFSSSLVFCAAGEDSGSDWSTDSPLWSEEESETGLDLNTPFSEQGVETVGHDSEIVRCVCEVQEENDFMIQVGLLCPKQSDILD